MQDDQPFKTRLMCDVININGSIAKGGLADEIGNKESIDINGIDYRVLVINPKII